MRLAEYLKSTGTTISDHLAEVALRQSIGLDPSSDCWPRPDAPVLVGEAPGRNTNPKAPLFPYPTTSAGGKLLTLSGLPAETYLRSFRRVNLFDTVPDKWSAPASRRAWALLGFSEDTTHAIVMLGRRVSLAAGCKDQDLEACRSVGWDNYVWAIPHPSGLSRAYNDPAVRARVRELLVRLAS